MNFQADAWQDFTAMAATEPKLFERLVRRPCRAAILAATPTRPAAKIAALQFALTREDGAARRPYVDF